MHFGTESPSFTGLIEHQARVIRASRVRARQRAEEEEEEEGKRARLCHLFAAPSITERNLYLPHQRYYLGRRFVLGVQ